MLDPKIVSLLTKQVNNEFFSAYLYLDFANYYEHKGLKGFSTIILPTNTVTKILLFIY